MWFPTVELGYVIPVVATLVIGGLFYIDGLASRRPGHGGHAVRAAAHRPARPAAHRGSTSSRSAGPRWPACSGVAEVPDDREAGAAARRRASWRPTTCASPTGRAATCCTASTSAAAGGAAGHGGPVRRGQVHAGPAARRHPPPAHRLGHGRRRPAGRAAAGRPARSRRPGHPGAPRLPGHPARKPAARPARAPTTPSSARRWTRSTRWAGSRRCPRAWTPSSAPAARRSPPAQAQQIALARLVLADPHTLVLDEATSLIDPRAARHLERSLAAVLEGRTVVAIAHRLLHRTRRRPGRGGRGRPDHRARLPRRARRRGGVVRRPVEQLARHIQVGRRRGVVRSSEAAPRAAGRCPRYDAARSGEACPWHGVARSRGRRRRDMSTRRRGRRLPLRLPLRLETVFDGYSGHC